MGTSPAAAKTILVAAKDRASNRVVAEPIQRTDRKTLHGFVQDYAAPDAAVYTHDHPSYRGPAAAQGRQALRWRVCQGLGLDTRD